MRQIGLHFKNRQFPDIVETADSTSPANCQNPLMGEVRRGLFKIAV